MVKTIPSGGAQRQFSGSLPEHIVLEMPNLSPTMEKGNIKQWVKKVGDRVDPGDVLAAIETDKATVDFEMQEEGFVAALLYPEGAKDVELGKVVAILVEDEADVAAFADYDPEAASAAPAAPASAPAAQDQPAASSAPSSAPAAAQSQAPVARSGDRVFVSPLAKKMADDKGLSLDQIKGTGPNNRIIKADVEEA